MHFTIVTLPHNVVEPIMVIIHDVLINQIQEPEDVSPDVFGESIIIHFNYWITNAACTHYSKYDGTPWYESLSLDDLDDISQSLYTYIPVVLPYIPHTVMGDMPYVSIAIRPHGGLSIYTGHSPMKAEVPYSHVAYVNHTVNRLVENTLMEGTY